MKLRLFKGITIAIVTTLFPLFSGWPLMAAEMAVIAPEHEVQISKKEENASKPYWKEIWDKAREQARVQDLVNAKFSYQQVLERKPNIVEARWEYCKLLTLLGDWKEASRVLEGLLELEPNNQEYGVVAGTTALKNLQPDKAVRLFGHVVESDPVGEFSESAILGMIEGYIQLKNNQSALLLLEQLYQRGGEKSELLPRLAQLNSEIGNRDKARYYYSKLVELVPEKKEYIIAAAKEYNFPGYEKDAAKYWVKYLQFDENYLPFHQNLSEYYLKQNRYQEALPHLIKLYENNGLADDIAKQIADLYYYELNRPDKALFYYEQMAKGEGTNREVLQMVEILLEKLAVQYLPIVENNAITSLWSDLDHISQNKEVLFLKMAELLRDGGKIRQEAELLEILYKHTKKLDIGYKLSKVYLQLKNYDGAESLYEVLEKSNYADKEYLVGKAEIELLKGREKNSIMILRQYLDYDAYNKQIIVKVIELSGKLGLVNTLHEIWQNIPALLKTGENHQELTLIYIDALKTCGLYSSAVLKLAELMSREKSGSENAAALSFYLSDHLLDQGLYFEAEQIIRQVLARDVATNRAIEKLIHISIQEGQFTKARSWLSLLEERVEGKDNADLLLRFSLAEIDLLVAETDYDEALDRIIAIKADDDGPLKKKIKLMEELDLLQARILYLQGSKEEVLNEVRYLKQKYPPKVEYTVLQWLVSDNNMKLSRSRKDKASYLQMMEQSSVLATYGDYENALQLVDRSLEVIPQSMRAKIAKIQILSSLSKYDEAIAILDEVSRKYPDQEYFNRLRLQFEFKRGNFKKIVEKVGKREPQNIAAVENSQKDVEQTHFWKKLLLARALWAENRRGEAMQVYDSLLASPVDSMFLEKMEVEKINFNLPPLKKSFWNIVTFTNPPEPDPITTVMEPHFVTNNRGKPVDDIATSMYGKYRWQKLIRKELSARKAIEDRDYFRAEKEYRSLLKEEKSEETIFDLAYIYNRLGMYGKEAELYELMKKKGPLYPGLDEYINANVLKRQPRFSTSFSTESKKGREGYINLKKKSYGVEGWFMPSYDQELSLLVFHNTYDSYDTTSTTHSNRFVATYSTYFEDLMDMNISFGTERPSGDGTNEILYKIEFIGRMTDSLEGYGRFEQDLVEDTMRSVTDSVISRDFEAGFKYDLFPRLFAGVDYRFRTYSDSNQQNRYKIWSMYHLFGETDQFKLKYSYESIRNNDDNVGRDEYYLANFFDSEDRVYWSPDIYWQHLFTFHFMHLFEGHSKPDSPLSYCSLDYSIGYEENSNVNHEFDMNIFLEINRHFLLKGNFKNLNGDDIELTEAGVSLIYRW